KPRCGFPAGTVFHHSNKGPSQLFSAYLSRRKLCPESIAEDRFEIIHLFEVAGQRDHRNTRGKSLIHGTVPAVEYQCLAPFEQLASGGIARDPEVGRRLGKR